VSTSKTFHHNKALHRLLEHKAAQRGQAAQAIETAAQVNRPQRAMWLLWLVVAAQAAAKSKWGCGVRLALARREQREHTARAVVVAVARGLATRPFNPWRSDVMPTLAGLGAVVVALGVVAARVDLEEMGVAAPLVSLYLPHP
jgi:hypothetical protein